MKKIEYVWRHLLYCSLEKREFSFGQQKLATTLGLSSSTVNLALKPLRQLGAVRIGKRHSEVIDPEKILYHWANHRKFQPNLQIRVDLPIPEIEGLLPNRTVLTAYTGLRERFGEPPTDYDKIYCYHSQPQAVIDRFQSQIIPGPVNLFILEADPHLSDYGSQVTLGQLFVDLWNLPDWYAKDSVNLLKTKINEPLPYPIFS